MPPPFSPRARYSRGCRRMSTPCSARRCAPCTSRSRRSWCGRHSPATRCPASSRGTQCLEKVCEEDLPAVEFERWGEKQLLLFSLFSVSQPGCRGTLGLLEWMFWGYSSECFSTLGLLEWLPGIPPKQTEFVCDEIRNHTFMWLQQYRHLDYCTGFHEQRIPCCGRFRCGKKVEKHCSMSIHINRHGRGPRSC